MFRQLLTFFVPLFDQIRILPRRGDALLRFLLKRVQDVKSSAVTSPGRARIFKAFALPGTAYCLLPTCGAAASGLLAELGRRTGV
jgi:hypothetical protein